MTLFDKLTKQLYLQAYEQEYDYPDEWVESQINSMSQFEFLKAISDALEEMK